MTIGTVYSAAKKDLQTLAGWTADQFTAIAAAVSTGWNKEHDGEGHHADVTATRVRAGSLGLTGVYELNAPGLTTLAPLVIPPKVTIIRVRTGGTVDLYGIQQDGAQIGDILVISGSLGTSLRITGLANGAVGLGTTPIGTEVVWDFAFFVSATLTLSASAFRSPLLLMYLPATGQNGANAWSILRGITP